MKPTYARMSSPNASLLRLSGHTKDGLVISSTQTEMAPAESGHKGQQVVAATAATCAPLHVVQVCRAASESIPRNVVGGHGAVVLNSDEVT